MQKCKRCHTKWDLPKEAKKCYEDVTGCKNTNCSWKDRNITWLKKLADDGDPDSMGVHECVDPVGLQPISGEINWARMG